MGICGLPGAASLSSADFHVRLPASSSHSPRVAAGGGFNWFVSPTLRRIRPDETGVFPCRHREQGPRPGLCRPPLRPNPHVSTKRPFPVTLRTRPGWVGAFAKEPWFSRPARETRDRTPFAGRRVGVEGNGFETRIVRLLGPRVRRIIRRGITASEPGWVSEPPAARGRTNRSASTGCRG